MEFQQSSPSTFHGPSHPLAKMIAFLQYHDVSWHLLSGNSVVVPVDLFVERIGLKLGYKINKQEFAALWELGASFGLSVGSFQEFGLWKGEARKQNINVTVKATKRPKTANDFNKRAMTSGSLVQPESRITKQSRLGLSEFARSSRFKMTQLVLQKKIVQNALDKKWEYLIKVGEMNSWGKQVKEQDKTKTETDKDSEPSMLTMKHQGYKILQNSEDIQIFQANEEGQEEALPLKVFDQKYQSMKKKCNPEQKSKNNMKGTMLLVFDKKQKVSKAKLGQKILQRDQQLNYLLLQIMRQKSVFEQQQQILSQCGVNS